jgi:hypothetical protein
MAHFKVISENFPGRSEENHEDPKSGMDAANLIEVMHG